MRLSRRTPTSPGADRQAGTVRVLRGRPSSFGRVAAGDIVVMDAVDLDADTARKLGERRPLAVLNARPFISGRFPNRGPQVLVEQGIVLLESETAGSLADGRRVSLADGRLYDGGREVLAAHEVSADEVAQRMRDAEDGLGTQLGSFSHNASEYLRREQDVLLHGAGVPDLGKRLAGRPAVVVAPGAATAELRGLRRFIHEQGPVLIGVDEGAERLWTLHLKPTVVVVGEAVLGEDASSSPLRDRTLQQARAVVVHSTGDRPVPARLRRLSIDPHQVVTAGNTLDVALLLAQRGGSPLIIPAGSPASLEEFLDGPRTGQASTFLTRLRLGTTVVEAAAVPRLYAGRVRPWHLVVILLIALIALALAVNVTPVGHRWIDHTTHNVGQRL